MTTTLDTNRTTTSNWPMLAALGVATALVLTSVGTFLDLTGNDTRGSSVSEELAGYLIVVAIIAIGTAISFAVATRKPTPVTTLVLGLLSVLTVVVAWTGLPAVFVAGAITAALGAPRVTTTAKIGLALCVLGIAGAVLFAVAG